MQSHVAALSELAACLPLARLVHAKLLRLDEAGEEPHFPISEMMSAIRKSARSHIINIEYEGWIPDMCPGTILNAGKSGVQHPFRPLDVGNPFQIRPHPHSPSFSAETALFGTDFGSPARIAALAVNGSVASSHAIYRSRLIGRIQSNDREQLATATPSNH
ncbi:hypothetical protein K9B32_18495 [Rhizobium sp. 3T7]|uniref:hypothetical protein n=1 Tax=Rhizobium sp. 3T7 TaxID=2874922 RepID=UPI001CCD56F6|nr:hypothetical protein [Rhizobium sp. 3T7]MBZ9792091.1 hypothetical protein [Rhizobium sp. 3T7]